jgi:hypothetical protein
MSHFSDIGFTIETPEQLDRVLIRAISEGQAHRVSNGAYVHWQPGEGVELWVQTSTDDQIVGLNPHFAGQGRLAIGVEDTVYNPIIPLDGAVIAWGTPPEAGAIEKGLFQLMVDVPNFRLVEDRIVPQARCELQIAAFAHTIAAYADRDDYKANSYKGGSFAPISFVPTGLLERDQIAAEAFLSGVVRQARPLKNPVTGVPFYYMLVETLGGTMDVVADPALLPAPPVEGGIIQGEFWLSACLLPSPSHNGHRA